MARPKAARLRELELPQRSLDLGIGPDRLGIRKLDRVADPSPEARVGPSVVGVRGQDGAIERR